MPPPSDPVIARQLKELPKAPGIYMFKDGAGRVMYVGKAKDLSKRVRSYFDKKRVAAEGRIKIGAMIRHIRRIETITVKNEAEALLLEGRLLKEYRPKYNTDFVDDKRFVLIRLDNSAALPRFSMVRVRNDSRSSYYGPFVHGNAAKQVYYALRERYGVILADTHPKELSDGSWQLYDDVRSEIFCSSNSSQSPSSNKNISDSAGDEPEFPNIVTAEEYRLRVTKACAFLEGQVRQVREELAAKMQSASENQRYEEAARCRDLLESIEFAKNPSKKFLRDPLMNVLDPKRAMNALQEALGMDIAPDSIECFDISHISGSFVVASLVHFANGKPDKRKYKRFRIREYVGNDDFRSMREVVLRHYGRLMREDKPLPKLIVIDGGAGQVSSAAASLIEAGVPLSLPIGNPQESNAPQARGFADTSSAATHPLLLGLAKREETFIFADGRPPLTLERDHLGLRLLQRVRDEAHRFANSYNADLRSKAIKASILDELPGVGPKKKEALMSAFSSLERLRKASAETIAAKVPGIGLKQATAIADFLKQ